MFHNKVYIAIGCNVGNWKNNFNQSFAQLNKVGFISNYSSVYFSKPYEYKEQNFFYNTAIELITQSDPNKLIRELQLIEKKIKKNKFFVNGPRRIDLDIIFYNKIILNKNSLVIPHPRAHLRDFVLYPIAEMNPYYFHPVKKNTVVNLLNKLNERYIVKKIKRQKGNVLIY